SQMPVRPSAVVKAPGKSTSFQCPSRGSIHRCAHAEEASHARQSAEYKAASSRVRVKPKSSCSVRYGEKNGHNTATVSAAADSTANQYRALSHSPGEMA